jgi:transcriptional regulator with XRE-family HTH domain
MRFRNLRQLRYAKALSITEIARRARVSVDTVQRAEDGASIRDDFAWRIFDMMQMEHGGSLQQDEYLLPDGRRPVRPRPCALDARPRRR